MSPTVRRDAGAAGPRSRRDVRFPHVSTPRDRVRRSPSCCPSLPRCSSAPLRRTRPRCDKTIGYRCDSSGFGSGSSSGADQCDDPGHGGRAGDGAGTQGQVQHQGPGRTWWTDAQLRRRVPCPRSAGRSYTIGTLKRSRSATCASRDTDVPASGGMTAQRLGPRGGVRDRPARHVRRQGDQGSTRRRQPRLHGGIGDGHVATDLFASRRGSRAAWRRSRSSADALVRRGTARRTLGGAMHDAPTVYLDHAATTPMVPAAVEAMTAHLADVGNASSLHASGRRASRVVEESRETIAQALGCRPGRGGLHLRRHRGRQPRGQGPLLVAPRRRPRAAPDPRQLRRAPRRARPAALARRARGRRPRAAARRRAAVGSTSTRSPRASRATPPPSRW